MKQIDGRSMDRSVMSAARELIQPVIFIIKVEKLSPLALRGTSDPLHLIESTIINIIIITIIVEGTYWVQFRPWSSKLFFSLICIYAWHCLFVLVYLFTGVGITGEIQEHVEELKPCSSLLFFFPFLFRFLLPVFFFFFGFGLGGTGLGISGIQEGRFTISMSVFNALGCCSWLYWVNFLICC